MKKVFLLLSFSFFLLQNSFSQITNTDISGGIVFEGEPFLAVNPVNPQNIVIAWMGFTVYRVSIKTKSSFDGGATWGNLHVQSHLSTTTTSADVSMSFRSDGTLYISYIDSRQNPDSGVIYLSQSADGGITWSSPNVIWNLTEDTVKKPIDRPWLVCDNSSTANSGMLYITTKPVPWIPAPNRPYLKTSADSGATWSTYRFVDTTGYLVGNVIQAPMAAVTTTSDGALCAAYPSYLPSQSIYPKIYLAKSYDRGNHLQYYELLNNPVAQGDTNLKSGYVLTADPVNPNRISFAYVGGQNGDADIFIVTTNNGGTTWSSPVRVNDDAISNGIDQDLVWANYNTAGDLAVTWRDRRNGTGTGFFQPCDVYATVSRDNGATFLPNFRLSSVTAAFDSVLMQNGNDFMSSKLVGDTICAAWGDVRSGKLNIYFAKANDSTGVTAGIVQVASEDLFSIEVYPNPAKEKITISLPFTNENATLEITDATGRKVVEKRNPKPIEVINCISLSSGSYNVSFTFEKYSVRKSFIVNR
jgi:hypothetical protein